MLRSYKVHSEQIEGVAKTLKDLYHTRRNQSPAAMGKLLPGSGRKQNFMSVTHADYGTIRSPCGTPGALSMRGIAGQLGSASASGAGGHAMPAMRCGCCGDEFPLTDFHYTKKSGLCIPCWEAKVM